MTGHRGSARGRAGRRGSRQASGHRAVARAGFGPSRPRPGPRKRLRHRPTAGSRGALRQSRRAPQNGGAGEGSQSRGRRASRGAWRRKEFRENLTASGSRERATRRGKGRAEGRRGSSPEVRADVYNARGAPFRCRGNAGRGLLLPGKRARRLLRARGRRSLPGPVPCPSPRRSAIPHPPVPLRASAGEGACSARLAGASDPRGPAGAGGTPAASFLSKK